MKKGVPRVGAVISVCALGFSACRTMIRPYSRRGRPCCPFCRLNAWKGEEGEHAGSPIHQSKATRFFSRRLT
jgi:hypothetical protein